MPLRQTSSEVSASGLSSTSALEAVLALKRLKIDLILTTSSEIEIFKQNQISTTTVPTTSENRDETFNYVPADDVTPRAYDKKRLYNIMLNAFYESTHYLCSDSFTLRDGIAIYHRMHEHFYGHTEADINRLRRLLQNFKGSTATCFKEDLVKFTTLMTEFEYAQARSSTEQERLQFLHNAFINDPRPNTKAYFMSCHSNMLTYHQTLERSVRYFEYALPEKPSR